MGANLKLDILVHNKTEVKGNLFQQVEPQSHAGEKSLMTHGVPTLPSYKARVI